MKKIAFAAAVVVACSSSFMSAYLLCVITWTYLPSLVAGFLTTVVVAAVAVLAACCMADS